jgi:hypothetical protein
VQGIEIAIDALDIPARFLTNTTANRCPNNGWNRWVTTRKPKSGLDDDALGSVLRIFEAPVGVGA